MRASKTPEHLVQVDGLRGLMIIIIAVFHVMCRFQQIYLNSNIVWMQDWGMFGVLVFLLISSFFLAVSDKKDDGKFSFWDNILKKILRLWPCYAVSLLLTFITVHLFYLPNRMSTWKDLLLNLIFVNGYIQTPYVDGAHWYLTTLISITVVIVFLKKIKCADNPIAYIIWIITGFLLNRKGMSHLDIIIGGLYIGVVSIGVALRKIYEVNNLKDQKINLDSKAWLWLFIIAEALLYTYMLEGSRGVIVLIFAIILFEATLLGKLNFLQNKAILFVGMISYPFYLIHQNISYVIEYYLMISRGYNYLHAILSLIVVFTLSVLLYFFVEKPAQVIIKRSGKNNMERKKE